MKLSMILLAGGIAGAIYLVTRPKPKEPEPAWDASAIEEHFPWVIGVYDVADSAEARAIWEWSQANLPQHNNPVVLSGPPMPIGQRVLTADGTYTIRGA